MKLRRTEIVIETERVIVIRRLRQTAARCEECSKDVSWVTLDEAARLAGLGSRATIRLIESEVLHSTESEDGTLLVCMSSLAALRSEGAAPGEPENRALQGQCLGYANKIRRSPDEDVVRHNKEEK